MNAQTKMFRWAIFTFCLLAIAKVSVAEEIEITTYYPSPYGVYEELRAVRMAIGDTFVNPSKTIDTDVDLMVEGAITRGGDVFDSTAVNLGHPTNSSADAEYSFVGPAGAHVHIQSESDYSAIITGYSNYIRPRSEHSFIGTGNINEIATDSRFSFIGTGLRNSIDSNSEYGVVVGGNDNHIDTDGTITNSAYSFIGAGGAHRLQGTQSVIVGGWNNKVFARTGAVGGGIWNQIDGEYGTIPGGERNSISAGASYSFAAGQNATAANVNSFVWAGDGAAHSSSVDRSFNVFSDLAYFDAQVGIGTSSPVSNAALTIDGSVAMAGQSAIGDDSVNFSRSSSKVEGDNSFSAASRFGDIDSASTYSVMLAGNASSDITGSNYVAAIAVDYGDINDSTSSVVAASENSSMYNSTKGLINASQTSRMRDSVQSAIIATTYSDIENDSSTSAIIASSGSLVDDGLRSAIIGGRNNEIEPTSSFGLYDSIILGGEGNTITENESVIIGSDGSEIDGGTGIILGGGYNDINTGNNSIAAGWGAQVNHSYSLIVDFAPGNQSTRSSDSFHFFGDYMYFGNTGAPKLHITDSDAGGGRPGIKFEGNGLQFFEGDDLIQDWSGAETFAFYSKFSNNRTNPAALQIYGPSSGSWGRYLGLTHNGSDGYIATDAGSVYVMGQQHSSDRRLKKDIKSIDNSLDILNGLNGVKFKWRLDEYPDRMFDKAQSIGVIAQEVEEVLPELVKTGEDGFKSVSYIQLVPVLIEAVKEQQNQINELKTIVKELQDEIK